MVKEGYVPVFWCCGVTGLEALKSANIDLAFTHAAGHMFITDLKQEDAVLDVKDVTKIAKVIRYCNKSQAFSCMSQSTLNCLESLDSIIQNDPGNRGVIQLTVDGDFTKAALALSHGKNVALITGFPVHDSDPQEETDGLPGTFVCFLPFGLWSNYACTVMYNTRSWTRFRISGAWGVLTFFKE